MHHAEIAPSAMSSAQFEEVGPLDVEHSKGLLPVTREAMDRQPVDNSIKWPLACRVLGRDGCVR